MRQPDLIIDKSRKIMIYFIPYNLSPNPIRTMLYKYTYTFNFLLILPIIMIFVLSPTQYSILLERTNSTLRMQVNSSFIIIKLVKSMSINSSHNRSIHTTIRYSLDYSYTSKFIRGIFLTLPLKLTNSKRFMRSTFHVVKTYVIPKQHSALNSLPPSRSYASAHCGRLKKHAKPLTNSKGLQPESDTTGGHKLVTLSVCPQENCKEQNCATGTDLSTGTPRPNPCGEPPQYHKQPPTLNKEITLELAGNATSKVPISKSGIVIDPNVQMNNKLKPQEQVTETYAAPVPTSDWLENNSDTVYVQKNSRTQAIINGMPSDSIINQK